MRVAIVCRARDKDLDAMRTYVETGLAKDTVVLVPRVSSSGWTTVRDAAMASGFAVKVLEEPSHSDTGRHLLESSRRFMLASEVSKQADLLVVFDDQEVPAPGEPLFGKKADLLRDIVAFQLRHGKGVQRY